MENSNAMGRASYQNWGFIIGAVSFFLLLLIPAPETLNQEAWYVLALGVLMAVWWSTEAIPVPATSLLPIIALPLLGISTMKEATHPYATPVIFLFFGGFIVAIGMQRWNLHKRIAVQIISRVGDHPHALLSGFMIASAFLSMWISNTAATLMMVPIAITVANTVLGDDIKNHKFTLSLLLGIAWASSIGGMGTIIGTPPNAFVVGYMKEQYDITITFTDWMKAGVPLIIALLPIAWFTLSKVVFRFEPENMSGGQAVIKQEKAKLGHISQPEIRVAVIFISMAILWILAPQLKVTGLNNTTIAIGGALAMFITPSGSTESQKEFLLDWSSTSRLPWGILLLFGGGLSLASAITSTGLAVWIGSALTGLADAPMILLMFGMIALVIFFTELTSNTAMTAALVPVLAAVADAKGIAPITLTVPIALAASCAFMLPVATPPNAVIYSTGYISTPQMARSGLILNILGIFVVSLLTYWLIPRIFT